MQISFWRLIHLFTAICVSFFLIIASLTGGILALDVAIKNAQPPEDLKNISLADFLPKIASNYSEITRIDIDNQQIIWVNGIDLSGKEITQSVSPTTGIPNFKKSTQSTTIQWVTSLHRSLFLHETGRLIMGLCALLLCISAISGIFLILRRGEKIFQKPKNEPFNKFWHIVLGKWFLLPILMIGLTGCYLSFSRFFIEEKDFYPGIEDLPASEPALKWQDFPAFKTILLAEVRRIDFPFAAEPEEFFFVKTKNNNLIISQFSGEVLQKIPQGGLKSLYNFSLDWHTGQAGVAWAIILFLSCCAILFFIFSGFVIFGQRGKISVKNPFAAQEANLIILFGSENGETFSLANHIHQQLLRARAKSFICALNDFQFFSQSSHFLIFTSTYGDGQAPNNAKHFLSLLEKFPQKKAQFCVVGFGSCAYPKFCQFAKDVQEKLTQQTWSEELTPLHLVNNQSVKEFSQWVKKWNEKSEFRLNENPLSYQSQRKYARFKVVEKTPLDTDSQVFSIFLKGSPKFTSGDLFCIFPEGKPRFYSIGKIGNRMALQVKLHPHGIGSNLLYHSEKGTKISGEIVKNESFRFPKKAPSVVMISNGTGIAPFLGMIHQNRKTECHLFAGFAKNTQTVQKYADFLQKAKEQKRISSYHFSFSRERDFCYVTDTILQHIPLIINTLTQNGVVMVCGSVAMNQKLEQIIQEHCPQSLSYYKKQGQYLTDYY